MSGLTSAEQDARAPSSGVALEPLRVAAVDGCPLCGAGESTPAFRAPDRLHGIPGDFSYHRCTRCATVFQNPRVIPQDLAACYPAEYYTHASPALSVRPRALRAGRERLRRAVVAVLRGKRVPGLPGRIARILARSPLLRRRSVMYPLIDELNSERPMRRAALDIGCGTGALLAALSRAGWEAHGVEWDTVAADVARRFSHRPVWSGDFRELDLPRSYFHLIVLQHVVEHLDDPRAALKTVAELLAPGGRVVLIYPNPDSLGARFFGSKWFHWDPPRHLVVPPLRALAAVGSTSGMSPVRLRTTARHAAITWMHSRAHRRDLRDRSGRPTIADRLAALAELALARAGFFVGEEAVLVLEKVDESHRQKEGEADPERER